MTLRSFPYSGRTGTHTTCVAPWGQKSYQEVDRQTGELFDLGPPDAVRLVVSDHGSGGISEWVLFPNRWLEQRGYLRFRGGAANRMSRIRERFKQWGIAALPSRIQRFLYRNALGALGQYEARVRYGMLDWSRTQAYFDENPYFPVLRINLRGRQPQRIVEPADYESLRDRLIGELEAWRHPETREPILEKACRREEVYSGGCLEEAADIVLMWALCDGYNLCFRLSSKAPLPSHCAFSSGSPVFRFCLFRWVYCSQRWVSNGSMPGLC